MKNKVWLTLLAAASLAVLSGTAEAQTRAVPVPSAAGANWIGSFSDTPLVVNDFYCTSQGLNLNYAPGALQQYTQVNGVWNQTTSVYVIASPVSVCGVTLQPINTGSFKLDVVGGIATDNFFNLGLANVGLYGQGGDDLLYNVGGYGVHGGDGKDRIKGSGTSVNVVAWNGDDTVCSFSGSLGVALGGADVTGPYPGDKFTGSALVIGEFETFPPTCPF